MIYKERASRWYLSVVMVSTLMVINGCSDSSSSAQGSKAKSSKTETTLHSSLAPTKGVKELSDTSKSVVTTVAVAKVEVFASPDDITADHVLVNPTKDGGPLVFLVKEHVIKEHVIKERVVKEGRPGWLLVYLPVRPNGSTGWVSEESVTLSQHDYRVEIHRDDHRLVVFKGTKTVLDESVGIGTSETPTPGGVFYITELIEALDPTGPYGPYAFGISGFSDQLDFFNGGNGVIGIHGTNDASGIGTDVSHGCIRMANEAIISLVGVLPLGTPVRILA